jgi:predicted PurR-regulated permease PerM
MKPAQIFGLAFFAILVLLLYQIAVIFTPFLVPVLWAIMLTRMAYPLYRRTYQLLNGRASLAAALVTTGIMLLGVLPVVYLTFLLVQQSIVAYMATSAWIEHGGLKQLPQYLGALPVGGSTMQEQIGRYITEGGATEDSIVQGVKGMGGFLLTRLSGFARNAASFAVDFFIMLFTLFFLLRDGARLYQRGYRLLPLRPEHKQQFFTKLDHTITAVVKGVVLTALAQGLLAGIAYFALRVPFPLLMTALSALCALLPFGGTALVWIPLAVYLVATGSTWSAVALVAWAVVVVGLVDNFLKPLLIGHDVQLSTLFLFFSIVGGLAAYGFIGMFIGPVLLAVLMTAVGIYEQEYEAGWDTPVLTGTNR